MKFYKMSEFKGTKGKWVLLTGYKSCGVSIGNRSTMVFSNDFDEDKSNALLISKAPEMLEMLQKILEINKHHNFNGHLINEQIEQLIKQATEL